MDLGKVSQTICTLLGDKTIKRVIFSKEASAPDYVKKFRMLILPESVLTGRSADEVIAIAVSEALKIRMGVRKKAEKKVTPDYSEVKQTILESLAVAITDLEAAEQYPGYRSIIKPARERQFLALEAVGTRLGMWSAYVLGLSSGAVKLPHLKMLEPILGGTLLRETLDILNNYDPPSYKKLAPAVDRLAKLLGEDENPETKDEGASEQSENQDEDQSEDQNKPQPESDSEEQTAGDHEDRDEEQEQDGNQSEEQDKEQGWEQDEGEQEEQDETQTDDLGEQEEERDNPVMSVLDPFSRHKLEGAKDIDITEAYTDMSFRPHWETIDIYSLYGGESEDIDTTTATSKHVDIQKRIESNVYSMVRRYVKSPQMVVKRRLERGNRLDRGVWRAATGQRTVFKRKKYDTGLDVSVCLCVDMSASMVCHHSPRESSFSGVSHYVASQLVATAVAKGLTRAGIPTAVIGFTSDITKTTSSPLLYRKQNICLYEILPYRKVRSTHGVYIKTKYAAENYDGESLVAIYERWVRPRPEAYKAMIVLSDGEPAGPLTTTEDLTMVGDSSNIYFVSPTRHDNAYRSYEFLAESLRRSLDSLRRLGVDPLGVGLYNNESVRKFYTNSLVLGTDASLETEIPKAITDYLIKEVICS